jgi:hypothetical protein
MRILNESRSSDALRDTAMSALRRIADPLIDLMFDTGITVQEFSRLLRERAVQRAATSVAKEGGRTSKSRVAIITGLARTEVARILNADKAQAFPSRTGQSPARRVLTAWYDNRRFLAANGDPAVLPIFGKRRSFEQLVATYSGGIPVRAMLDQLSQISAVEMLSGQRVKVKARVPVFKGMTSGAIANVGERTGDLLGTLRHNLHAKTAPLFEGTALMCDVDVGTVPLVRRQVAEQGAAFIEGATSLLTRSRNKRKSAKVKKSSQLRVGVTVYYFEDEISAGNGLSGTTSHKRRKNLQRQRRGSRISHR